jgi:hypothetical protein
MLFETKKIHCMDCNYEGAVKTYTKGSFAVEILLWLCFLLPGLIYSMWRITSGRYDGCPDCKSEKAIDLKKWQARQVGNKVSL